MENLKDGKRKKHGKTPYPRFLLPSLSVLAVITEIRIMFRCGTRMN